jgi:hypothetical protein
MAQFALMGWIARKCNEKPNGAAALLTGKVLIEEFKAIHSDNEWSKKSEDDPELVKLDELNKLEKSKEEVQKQAQDNPDVRKKNKEKDDRLRKLDQERLHVYFKHVHALKKDAKHPGQTALCLSGGGIRSAAFALGLMQGLAKQRLLHQFDYLSTVSGGGYMGAWLTAWAHRAARSSKTFEEIENELGDLGKAPEPLRELRENKDYLTPKVGIGSPDTWAALAIVIRNLLLNWLVFLPLLVSVLLIPRILQWLLTLSETIGARYPWARLSLCFAGLPFVAWGIYYAMKQRSPGKRPINDFDFGLHVVVPVTAGAFFLVAGTCGRELPSLLAALLFAAGLFRPCAALFPGWYGDAGSKADLSRTLGAVGERSGCWSGDLGGIMATFPSRASRASGGKGSTEFLYRAKGFLAHAAAATSGDQ